VTTDEHAKEIQMLEFLVEHAKAVTSQLEGRCMCIENPLTSDIWKYSPLLTLIDFGIFNCFDVDQCRFS